MLRPSSPRCQQARPRAVAFLCLCRVSASALSAGNAARPVKTIAIPSLFAAAITSASRTEPPGWITAVAPALPASSTPSGKGKNASDATTLPCKSQPVRRRLDHRNLHGIHAAHLARADADRLPFARKHDRIRFHVLANFPRKEQRARFRRRRRALRHHLQIRIASVRAGPLPAPACRPKCVSDRSSSRRLAARHFQQPQIFLRREFFQRRRGSNPGATMHSTNSFATSSAVAASSARLNASTPPNADTGSHASAFKYASRKASCSAAPQGLLCLMIATAGRLKFLAPAPTPHPDPPDCCTKAPCPEVASRPPVPPPAAPREYTAPQPGADFLRSACDCRRSSAM